MADSQEWVVLVDGADRQVGTAEKLHAHREGMLHRAFSVFVLNSRREVLLQRRADGKYHTGGLWSNTCCGHPRPGEPLEEAARRRLEEEMGFRCELQRVGEFVYRAPLADGLEEHEYDHVFIGWYDGDPEPDPAEVSEWRWASAATLHRRLSAAPQAYTPWLAPALDQLLRAQTPLRNGGSGAPHGE